MSDVLYYMSLGQDSHSWGLSYKGKIYHNGVGRKYCEAFFESETKIGLLLNMCEGTLTFFKNGVNLGVAFSGLTRSCEPLYPMVTSTSSLTEVKVGVRRSRYLSLQDKCRAKIRHSIRHDNHIDDLPLPNIMKRYIKKSWQLKNIYIKHWYVFSVQSSSQVIQDRLNCLYSDIDIVISCYLMWIYVPYIHNVFMYFL